MLTIAYVGFGVSVREYHIPYVENREDIRVKYVFRREEDIPQFAEYEPFYPEAAFTSDLDQVLRDQEVSLVVVSAPDRFHVPYAKRILSAGKHALVEKPFAPTAAEALEVFALAREKGWKALRLDVLEGNEPALRLYERAGFVYIEAKKIWYESTGLASFLLYEYAV